MASTQWVYTLIRAMNGLGGTAHVSELSSSVFVLREQNPQMHMDDSIHGHIHSYSFDHAESKKKGMSRGDARDVFEKIKPATWKIRDISNPFVRFALRAATSKETQILLRNQGETDKSLKKLEKEFESDQEVFVHEHWRSLPVCNSSNPHTLTISHADVSPFAPEGLRAFFEYRDLGINTATQGDFGAHVIRAVPGQDSATAWHSHDLNFQMVYVTKGWVEFEYAGHGKVMLRAGSSVLQLPGIVHREVRHSDDMELLEITAPAAFETKAENAPE